MNNRRVWPPVAASLFVYLAVTIFMGRESLQTLSTATIHDNGDPLLTAAILYWNSIHLPFTSAWWQFPVFYPTADSLAFSEHLLGLSVIATPIEWLTGNILATYNLVTLLTYPLCGMAMFALVHRLTRNAPAAFIAGLAYAFAPYRISQLPHIQMLAVFWAPLALLGLHAYLESGRRRWLALYGAAWLLQVAANGYTLFFFSLFIAFWVLWFVVARADWRAFRAIAVSTVLAVLPLVPILFTYLVVHRRHGFVRGVDEIKFFSGDVAAVLCAPELMTFWGHLRVACRPEGELFPGATVMVIFCLGVALMLGWLSDEPQPVMSRAILMARRLLMAVALCYFAIALSLLIAGPWRLELGPVRATASSLRRPLMVGLPSLLLALGLSATVRRAIVRHWTMTFYLTGAVVMWLFTLGPSISYMGYDTGFAAPFLALMQLPGADGLRVPARFWIVVVLSLSTAAGLVVARLTERRQAVATVAFVAVFGAGILADGWVPVMPVAAAPQLGVPAITLVGHTVLELPMGDVLDIPGTYFAATGGWRSVNGYSGYYPSYYDALVRGTRAGDGAAFEPFRAMGDLDVLVSSREGQFRGVLEQQPGVRVITQNDRVIHYFLPQRGRAEAGDTAGQPIPITAVSSTCATSQLPLATDRHDETRWVCGPESVPHAVVIDLGRSVSVGAVVNGVGRFNGDNPSGLTVETSTDGNSWQPAWQGSLLGQTVRAGLRSPLSLRIVVPFAPRPARYIRLTHPAEKDYYWSIAELEVWTAHS